MKNKLNINSRALSVCAFSFLFAYILSFPFEGQVLYSLLDAAKVDASQFILAAIIAHFLGQFTCGFFCKSPKSAKRIMFIGMGVCIPLTAVFFFTIPVLWLCALVGIGYASGCAVAAWGYFLLKYTPKNERIKTCADVLIYSNLIMIAINIVATIFSANIGLILSMLCLPVGMVFTLMLPMDDAATWTTESAKPVSNIRKPMGILFLFVAIITVDSGLMYQVINPAFEHLTFLTSWYWAVPYIIALAVMRNLPMKAKRPLFLYVGMGMIMTAFITFMLLGRDAVDYLVVDTLMLGACGIFDLFWWSIIGETLDYAKNPVSMFGIGLSANVFGVLCGDVVGVGVTAVALPGAQVAVIALCVVCVTLIILPPLNRQLALLLKSHAYLTTYSALPEETQKEIATAIAPLDPLTERESELLKLVLDGKSNKEIAAVCFITENTVKTHLSRVYSKYAVASRAELISLLLRSQER